MNKTKTIILGVFSFIVISVFSVYTGVASTYNNFANLDESVNQQWSNVESKMQRRYNLIPNIVTTVKGVSNHEEKILASIAEARSKYTSATTIEEQSKASMELEQNIRNLITVVNENYPEIASTQGYIALMAELEGAENRISVETDTYSQKVANYNKAIRKFPDTIVASMFGFNKAFFRELLK